MHVCLFSGGYIWQQGCKRMKKSVGEQNKLTHTHLQKQHLLVHLLSFYLQQCNLDTCTWNAQLKICRLIYALLRLLVSSAKIMADPR